MRYGPGKAVELPDDHNVEPTPVRVGHELVEFRALLFRARDSDIDVLAGHFSPAALAILPQLAELHLWRLAIVCRADPRVDCGSHAWSPFVAIIGRRITRSHGVTRSIFPPAFTHEVVAPDVIRPLGP